MRGMNFILRFTALFILLFIAECGTGKKLTEQDELAQPQKAFELGIERFFQQRYAEARNILYEYNKRDSLFTNYQSYAFLAECYNQLGKQDSGKITYENIIRKLSSTDHKSEINNLKKWYSEYPAFPEFLRNNFEIVPYDVMPEPVGGIRAIEKKLVYPLRIGGVNKEGRIFVLTQIDENGKPINFNIIYSLGKRYDEAAIKAIRQVSFTIPKIKGIPRKVWVSIPIVFMLK